MAPDDPELLAEWNRMQQELKDLEWAKQTYAQRQQEKEERRLKKEFREKRKQFNDPYEVDQYKAMKAGLKQNFERGRDPDYVPPKKEPYPYHTNFAVIRELSLDKTLVMKEWLVRSYNLFNPSSKDCHVILHLEELPFCENKMELEVTWDDAIEILHRRCFNVRK